MNNFKYIYRKLKELFYPTTKFNIILSSFLCIFTTFALVSILSVLIYKEVPQYDQLIAGATIWTGYNKSMDLFLIKSLISLLPLSFLFFKLIINFFMKYTPNYKYGSIFLVWFFYILLKIFANPNDMNMILRNIILFTTILICYFIIYYKNNTNKFSNFILIGFLLEFLYCIVISIFTNFTNIETTFLEEHFYIGQIVILLLLIILSILLRLFNNDIFENRLISLLQIFIPLIFLSFYNFSYNLESGGTIQLNSSQRFKYLCIFICLFLIAYNIYKFLKKSSGILISTFISVSTFSCYTVPDPVIASDFFHVGEYTVPLQQFLSFNKIPFKDFTPIHGLMDYYYATINHIFYDGKYFTINFAQTIGSIILAIIIAIIFYYYTDNKNISLFILITFTHILLSLRWSFAIMFLIVMLSKKANKNSLCFMWYWIFMSILSIAWNPSLSGSVAVGFLPIVIYRLFNKSGIQTLRNLKEKNFLKKTLFAWIPLIILGIFFIPMFFNILTYLKENMNTTLETNGMGIFENIHTENLIPSILGTTSTPWFDIFGFVLILLIPLILCFYPKLSKFRSKFIELLILTYITTLLFSNYIFGRFDNCKTLYFISTLIITLIPYLYSLLSQYIKNHKLILITLIIIFVLPLKQDITNIPNKIFSKIDINNISNDLVYVNGDTENLPHLGNGYMSKNFLNEIKDVSYIINSYCNTKDSTFLDAANEISYYKILNRNVPTKFTSVYNISNDLLQDEAIDQLNQNNPEVILISPSIELDGAPFSLRCLKLYKWALNSQYKPYSYNNILYMAKDNSKLPEAVLDESYFGKVLHKENLGYLPYTWASDKNISALENVDVNLNLEDSYNIEKINSNNLIKISSESGYLDFNLDSAINGSDCDFIKLELKFNDSYTRVGSLYFNANDSELDSTNKFSFNIKTGTMLIPVSSNPYWFSSKEIRNIRLGFEACIPNEEIEYNISFLKLKK